VKAPRGRFSSMDASLGAWSVVGRRDNELKHRNNEVVGRRSGQAGQVGRNKDGWK
jgi:hypothetical protein